MVDVCGPVDQGPASRSQHRRESRMSLRVSWSLISRSPGAERGLVSVSEGMPALASGTSDLHPGETNACLEPTSPRGNAHPFSSPSPRGLRVAQSATRPYLTSDPRAEEADLGLKRCLILARIAQGYSSRGKLLNTAFSCIGRRLRLQSQPDDLVPKRRPIKCIVKECDALDEDGLVDERGQFALDGPCLRWPRRMGRE